MELNEILNQYKVDTTKASEICRQSNYSLIAVCWILANESVESLACYKLVLFFVVMSLCFDFIQYFYRGIRLGIIYEEEESNSKKNNNGIINDNYSVKSYPNSLNVISTGLYYTKIICTLVAFVMLMWKLF